MTRSKVFSMLLYVLLLSVPSSPAPVFQGSDTSTGIALANPVARSAHLKANLYSDGKLVNTRELQIPSYGHRAWSLNEIFPSNSAAGHVEIDSDVGLVGFEAFSQLDRWSATSMQLPGEVSEFIFPIPPLDKSSWAGIAIANLTAFDMELTLTASSTRLSPVAGPVKRIIKPHGELISVISDLFSNFPASGGVITIKGDIGVARVFGIKPAFSGLAVVGREDSRALASFALESTTSRELILSPLGGQTSISMLNLQDIGAKVRLSMIGTDRRIVGENEIRVDSRTPIYGTLAEIAKAQEAGNLLLMSADFPLESFQIESNDKGFLIIPGQTFKARATYASGQRLSRVSGGVVISKDGTASVSIPLNALKENVTIEVKPLSTQSAPALESNRRLLAATEFLPESTEFLLPAAITIPLLRRLESRSSRPLEVVNSKTSRYQPSGSTALISFDGTSAIAEVTHFSIFALTGERPTIQVSPSSASIDVNRMMQFTSTVSGTANKDVEWFVDMIPGGNMTVGRIRSDGLYTAPMTVPPAGMVTIRAVSLDEPEASFQVPVTITVLPQPLFGPGPSMGGSMGGSGGESTIPIALHATRTPRLIKTEAGPNDVVVKDGCALADDRRARRYTLNGELFGYLHRGCNLLRANRLVDSIKIRSILRKSRQGRRQAKGQDLTGLPAGRLLNCVSAAPARPPDSPAFRCLHRCTTANLRP